MSTSEDRAGEGLSNAEIDALNRSWLHNDVNRGIEWLVPVVERIVAAREAAAANRGRAEAAERIAQAIEAKVVLFGGTCPGDPLRAGLIEGYRDAARIARADCPRGGER